ncbi:hypothetical protein ACFC4G_32220 [Streptomyces sp. NPDC056002]
MTQQVPARTILRILVPADFVRALYYSYSYSYSWAMVPVGDLATGL